MHKEAKDRLDETTHVDVPLTMPQLFALLCVAEAVVTKR
jgi:hypothetical protein